MAQLQKKDVYFFAPENKIRNWRRINEHRMISPSWGKWNLPNFNKIELIKQANIECSSLMYEHPTKRSESALSIISDNWELILPVIEKKIGYRPRAANVTITYEYTGKLGIIKTDLFNEIHSVEVHPKQTIRGQRKQNIDVNIEIEEVELQPDMLRFEDEDRYMLSTEILPYSVIHSSITAAQNSCVSVAHGCMVDKDKVLIIGNGARFTFAGSSATKEVTQEYYLHFNKNYGETLQLPIDLDIFRFNFFAHNYKEALASGNYIKKDTVSVCKTDNGNYVVFQSHPNRCKIVTKTGEIIDNDAASWGNARAILTPFISLDNYNEAIEHYESILKAECEKANARYNEKMQELHEVNRGWYIVELPCFQHDFNRGGHKERWTNWKILADSPMDAYNKAVEGAEAKGYFWFKDATKCQIDYYGVWTDEKENMLRVEGLI